MEPSWTMAHILIVEDGDDSRDALRILLELSGHRVSVAESGEEGVKAAVSSRPDLALIDIGLPDIDGYEAARRIRTEAGGVRLIAMTGFGGPRDRQQALDAGFDAHVTKPIDPQRLASLLQG